LNYDITATGVVISTMPIGEYDKRVVMLTGEHGKIHAFARGARRPTSPMLAGTEPLTFARFKLREGKNSYSLTGVEVADYFEGLRKDFDRVLYGMYFLELASYFGKEELAAAGQVKLLYSSLKGLENKKEELTPEFIRTVYELKTFSLEGLLPEGKDSGLLCGAAVYAVDFISKTDPLSLFSFKLEKDAEKELASLAGAFRRRYTDDRFNSLRMIEGML